MNIERLRELHTFNHMMAVELEDADYGGRHWTPVRQSDVDEYIRDMQRVGYYLSDVDHANKCECRATWDEWMFYARALDILRRA